MVKLTWPMESFNQWWVPWRYVVHYCTLLFHLINIFIADDLDLWRPRGLVPKAFVNIKYIKKGSSQQQIANEYMDRQSQRLRQSSKRHIVMTGKIPTHAHSTRSIKYFLDYLQRVCISVLRFASEICTRMHYNWHLFYFSLWN